MGQPDAGLDGEAVDALLGLLDQCFAEDLPRAVGGIATHLLQRLVYWHGALRSHYSRVSCLLRSMIIGSSSMWLMLVGMMARRAAT